LIDTASPISVPTRFDTPTNVYFRINTFASNEILAKKNDGGSGGHCKLLPLPIRVISVSLKRAANNCGYPANYLGDNPLKLAWGTPKK